MIEREALPSPLQAGSVAIGVMAYNEAANIGHLLDSLLHQSADERISRIVVVASGCTDRTCDIVRSFAARDPRVQLAAEAERGGKILAVNEFFRHAGEPLLLISAADVIYSPQAVEKLTDPFVDERIGIVGSHPVPLNRTDRFIGFTVNLMWRLHHEVALSTPKMGEVIAFRNVFRGLDPARLADEVQVEYGIRAIGYEAAYAPEAIVYNRGPESLREFVAQRTRWYALNLQMQRVCRFPVSTNSLGLVARAARRVLLADRPRLDWVVGAAALELYCRIAGTFASLGLGRPERRLWAPHPSTKMVVNDAPPNVEQSVSVRS
jgi:poly-beta-1,6-N-acetyl-D-glucosamine synthase